MSRLLELIDDYADAKGNLSNKFRTSRQNLFNYDSAKQALMDEISKTGGKREGAGRLVSTNPADKMISVKLTQAQYAKWVELGASRWLKRMLETTSALPSAKSEDLSD